MKKVPVIILFVLAAVLRFVNLGYSDYQGDEIKALYNPREASSVQFFLDQRKGPMQFLFTAGLKTFSPDYRNRLLVRFPFALAGFGSIIIFYYLAKSIFNQNISFYSTLFIATNGFFVAFSRLVQYQSLVIFFGLLSVYLVKRYSSDSRQKWLFVASLSLALTLLSHYDGMFFFPIILGLLISKFLQTKDRTFKHVVIPTCIFLIITGAFYIPFALNISKNIRDYWAGRITGEVSGKISSSRYLFSIYQPIYGVQIYTILGLAGISFVLFLIIYKIFDSRLSKIFQRVYKNNVFELVHQRFRLSILISLVLWFFLPFFALEILISIPGTHIYTYLIPLFLFMGVLLFHIELILYSLTKRLKILNIFYLFGITVLFSFLFLQSFYAFTDHSGEYPWANKKFFLWTLPKPSPVYHLSVFGFPYYRHWDEISDYIKNDGQASYYTTNERDSISRYHVNLQKNGGLAGYYVYIRDPQTFTNEITNKRIAEWVKYQTPEVQYKNNGTVVSEIYLLR